MAEWRLLRIGADYDALAKEYGLDPVVMRVMRNRGVESREDIAAFLQGDVAEFDKTDGFADMDAAVRLLEQIRTQDKKVRVIGDYDIDGICATAILVKGLKKYGIRADYAIPNRMEDGYGLSVSLIERAATDGVEAVVTCDNGINAHEAILAAGEKGIPVIVTDHHEIMRDESNRVAELLPAAAAVINPKRNANTLAFGEFCGAYVAYKLVSSLLKFNSETFTDKGFRDELLSLAAFATVGDIMPLQKENRALVKYGLYVLGRGGNAGMQALIGQNDLSAKEIKAHHVGFVLGPCINATGRLDTAERALKLLLTEDGEEAREIAIELKRMNEVRKDLTLEGEEAARRIIAEQGMEQDRILVVYLPDAHESVAGIIAGRLKERFYKPTLVFTPAKEGIKGSGRSVAEYDMYVHLCEHKELFTKFGGHKMAAGISMPAELLPELRKKLNASAEAEALEFHQVINIDVDMPLAYVSKELIEDLECLEPYGNGNPKPVFAVRNLMFTGERLFGADGRFASYRVTDEQNRKFELKYFGDVQALHRYADEKYGPGTAAGLYQKRGFTLSVIYQPELNTYRGVTAIQYRLLYYK